MGKEDSKLKNTLKELETAFQEWDALVPEAATATVEPFSDFADSQGLKERTQSILDKLKTQIEELSE